MRKAHQLTQPGKLISPASLHKMDLRVKPSESPPEYFARMKSLGITADPIDPETNLHVNPSESPREYFERMRKLNIIKSDPPAESIQKLEKPILATSTDTAPIQRTAEFYTTSGPSLQKPTKGVKPIITPQIISGNNLTQTEKCVKVFTSSISQNPTLAFIDLRISSIENRTDKTAGIKIKALHDSGCAKTIIKHSVFEQLLRNGHIDIIAPERPIVLISCTGEAQPVEGSANIVLHFEGTNGIIMTYELNVLVHTSLSQDFLLGRDFTGSDAKAFETNDHLYLTDRFDIFWDPIRTAEQNKTLCQIPLISTRGPLVKVATNHATVILPFTISSVKTHINKHDNPGRYLPIEKNGFINYEIKSCTIEDVSPMPFLMQFEAPHELYIPLYNNTHEDIVIEADTDIAEIEIYASDISVYHIAVREYDMPPITIQSNHARPKFINDDEAMDEEEKEEAFMNFVKRGYHHPSMTKEVEQKASLTEMYIKSTTPVLDKDFEAQFDLSHLTKSEQRYARKIFRKHIDVFSKHACDLGCAKDIEMDIPLLTKEPHIQKYIPVPHAVRPQLRAVLDQMLEFGIIRECNEPSLFCSNLLVTKKKDGASIRVLLDGRLLNHYMQRLPVNLVTHPELYAHLVKKKHVTVMDLSDSFFQMLLKKECQPLTAFYSEAHGKRYCFTRCPQGLKNSPLHLKLLLDTLVGDMALDVIHYADDIMVATDGTMEEHLDKVGEVLLRLKNGNIKIRPSKISVAKTTVDFLGVVWEKGQLSIPDAKVQSFMKLPSPTTPKVAKSVICMIAFYRKFIPYFAHLAKPIMDLALLHPKQFKWTYNHELCFRKLLQQMKQHATLYLPDPAKPYYVQTDASDFCGAGRVFQKDEDGDEKLLSCVSRTFTKTERAYSTVKKEVLALLYTLKTMEFFLRFAAKIIILVDAQAILFLRVCRESTGILLRFSMELSMYDCEIHHVKGEDNEISDLLSRHHSDIIKLKDEMKAFKPMNEKQAVELLNRLRTPDGTIFTKEEVAFMLEAPSLPSPDDKPKKKSVAKEGPRTLKNCGKTLNSRKVNLPKEVKYAPGARIPTHSCQLQAMNQQCIHTNTMSYTDFNTVSKAVLTGTLTKQQFMQAQRDDEYIATLIQRRNKLKKFLIIDDLFYFKNQFNLKLVLPVSLLDIVINAKHFTVFGLHFSRSRIQRDIQSRYHVQQHVLQQKLKHLRDNCLICQFNTTGHKDQELRKTDYIYSPRTTWAVDLMPNMPLTPRGNKVALLAVDLFTGYIQICPMKDRKTETLIDAIRKTIIKPFGIPKFLRSDNEPGLWTSNEFYEFLQPMGTKFFPTSVGSPWGNGHAERSIRTIKEGARKFLMQEKLIDQWDTCDEFFTNAHNSSTSVYGFSPEELMFATQIPNASDLLQFWPNFDSHSQYMEKIFPEAEKMREKHQQRANHKKDKNRTYKNQSRISKTFELGQIVAHRQLQLATGPNMSMKPKFDGPYVINSFDEDGVSAKIAHMDTGYQMRAHFTNLMPINFDPAANRAQTDFDQQLDNLSPILRDKYTLQSKSRRNLNIDLDDEDRENVNARFIDDDGQPIRHDLADKVLSINIDEHSPDNLPDTYSGRLIDDDYDDMQEDIRLTIDKARAEGRFGEQMSISSSEDSEIDFNEEDLLFGDERDSPAPSSSQMFRRPDDHLSDSDTDNESTTNIAPNNDNDSLIEQNIDRNSTPRPPDQRRYFDDDSDISFDDNNVQQTYSQRSLLDSDNDIIQSSQPISQMIVPQIMRK